jgi:BMFP domain-containing protein YqiC
VHANQPWRKPLAINFQNLDADSVRSWSGPVSLNLRKAMRDLLDRGDFMNADLTDLKQALDTLDELRHRVKELEAANNIIDNMNTMDKATGSPTGSKA